MSNLKQYWHYPCYIGQSTLYFYIMTNPGSVKTLLKLARHLHILYPLGDNITSSNDTHMQLPIELKSSMLVKNCPSLQKCQFQNCGGLISELRLHGCNFQGDCSKPKMLGQPFFDFRPSLLRGAGTTGGQWILQ